MSLTNILNKTVLVTSISSLAMVLLHLLNSSLWIYPANIAMIGMIVLLIIMMILFYDVSIK